MLKTFILALLVPVGIYAQTDEKANAFLKQVSETNNAYKDIEATFSYTLENKDAKVNDTRDGQLALFGSKFHLQLMGQDIYSDGTIVWYDMKQDKEVHIKTMEEFSEETDLNPATIFSQYEKGFKSKFHGEETKNGKTLQIIDLFPDDPGKKPYSRIRLSVDKMNNHIVYTQTFGKDGTNYLLEVTEMKTNSGISPQKFVFDAKQYESADYEIVDFR